MTDSHDPAEAIRVLKRRRAAASLLPADPSREAILQALDEMITEYEAEDCSPST